MELIQTSESGTTTILAADEDMKHQLFPIGEEGQRWYAFHTRPRCEKKASSACEELGLHHYLPLRKRVTRKGQDRYSFMVPLFPGYLFSRCDQNERLALMRRGYMVRWIEVVDQHLFREELTSIYLACHKGAELTLYPQMKKGRRVRITQGLLMGIEGMISKRKENFKVVLNVSVLGSAVAVEVDTQDVELVDH